MNKKGKNMSRTTRESETRAHEKRSYYNMEYISPLALPPGVAKEGKRYHWASVTVRGADNYRLEDLLREGWDLVEADRADSYVNFDPLGRNPLGNKYISRHDAMLVEIDEYKFEERLRRFHETNDNRLKALRGVANDLGGYVSPISSINSF